MQAFAALSDPTRVRIIELLRRKELDAGAIAEEFPSSRPGISRHLRILREHDLVRVRVEGQRRVYSLNPGPLMELDRWLEPYRAFWAARLDALENHIQRTKRKRG